MSCDRRRAPLYPAWPPQDESTDSTLLLAAGAKTSVGSTAAGGSSAKSSAKNGDEDGGGGVARLVRKLKRREVLVPATLTLLAFLALAGCVYLVAVVVVGSSGSSKAREGEARATGFWLLRFKATVDVGSAEDLGGQLSCDTNNPDRALFCPRPACPRRSRSTRLATCSSRRGRTARSAETASPTHPATKTA
jgi:hypothetical protein